VPDDETTPAAQPPDDPAPTRRHRRAIRISAAAVTAVLTGLLGFAIVVQVHQNSSSDNLANLRDDDLVGILDNQNARADRLRQQIGDLQDTLRRLQDSGDRSAAARQQAEQDARALGVLLGTLPATGPGVLVTVSDPAHHLHAEDLLDVVEELRGAGAEAIQFGRVRVSTTTAFTDTRVHGGTPAVDVDGSDLTAPYRVLAIGDAKTLDTALNIPGGVAATIRNAGGDLTVSERQTVTITVTRVLRTPRFAAPSGH
jgi:uncharacterized protein YlxW (UPF0749 family)